MRYICAQPANSYYLWQVEVMINNFLRMGINPNQMDILLGYDTIIPEEWSILQQHYNTVRFFFYKDTRKDKSYIPSIYFNLMKQHLLANPELKDEVLFTHDSDIIFTKPVNFNWLAEGDTWYVSDTKSYLNYDYIQQKGNDIYEDMCTIVGIDKLIPKLMNSNTGGAQYIVKNTDYSFWNKVEQDSIKLYQYFCKKEPYWKGEGYPIQKWTAGMWSYIWNAWMLGNETVVSDKISFAWATSHIDELDRYPILHNAGVTSDSKDLFFKGNYINKLPYDENLNLNLDSASNFYWEEVQRTAKVSPLHYNMV